MRGNGNIFNSIKLNFVVVLPRYFRVVHMAVSLFVYMFNTVCKGLKLVPCACAASRFRPLTLCS